MKIKKLNNSVSTHTVPVFNCCNMNISANAVLMSNVICFLLIYGLICYRRALCVYCTVLFLSFYIDLVNYITPRLPRTYRYSMTALSYIVARNASLYPSTYTVSPLYMLSQPYSLVQLFFLNEIGSFTELFLSLIV